MSRQNQYIRDAVSKGCWFDFESGELVSYTGHRIVPTLYGKQRYPRTAVEAGKQFSIHRFVAYILYGESVFEPGIHVRHLNGNRLDLSRSNIAIGTASENERDKPKEVRSKVAREGNSKSNQKGCNHTLAKLTEIDVCEIRQWYNEVKSQFDKFPYGALTFVASFYGMSKSSLKRVVYNKSYKEVSV